MNTKPVRTMLLGIMVMLVGVAFMPISSGSGVIIPLLFLLAGFVIGSLGFNQKDR